MTITDQAMRDAVTDMLADDIAADIEELAAGDPDLLAAFARVVEHTPYLKEGTYVRAG